MVLDAVSNFVRGNTDSDINSTSNTLSVKDASIFPDPSSDGEYNVVIWDVANHPRPDQDSSVEILRVTARDTTNNDLTVSRGQEATSASSHPSGSAVHLSPTAKMFGDIETTISNFWDSGTQELTADVNNQLVNADILSITQQRGLQLDNQEASPWIEVESRDLQNKSTVSFDVSSKNFDVYRLEAFGIVRPDAVDSELWLRLNNDSTTSYEYYNKPAGNMTTGDDKIALVKPFIASSDAGVGGSVDIFDLGWVAGRISVVGNLAAQLGSDILDFGNFTTEAEVDNIEFLLDPSDNDTFRDSKLILSGRYVR